MSGCGTGTFNPDDTPSPITPVAETAGVRPIVDAGCCSTNEVTVPDEAVTVPELETTPVTTGQGLREFLADFNTATHVKNKANLLIRPDAVSFDYLTAYSFGPKDIADVTGGAQNRVWRAVATNNEDGTGQVVISRANDTNDAWIDDQTLFSYTGVAKEIDLAFEQAARAVVCLEIDGRVWLYWFDPNEADFVLENLTTGRTPRVLLDDPIDTTISDVLLFYVNDVGTGKIEYRQQRDGYAVVYDTPVITADENYYLEEVFRATDNRVVFFYSVRNTTLGQYTLHRVESTLYPFTSDVDEYTAELSILSGDLVVAVIDYSVLEEMGANLEILSGILATVLINHTLTDIDEYLADLEIVSGTLVVVVITHTAFDIDEYKAELEIVSGTLVAIVIDHICFDIDEFQAGVSIQGGTLAP